MGTPLVRPSGPYFENHSLKPRSDGIGIIARQTEVTAGSKLGTTVQKETFPIVHLLP
jgi:hypothetical protein